MKKEEMLRRMDPELQSVYSILPPYSIDTYEDILRCRVWDMEFYRSQPAASQPHPDLKFQVLNILNGSSMQPMEIRICAPAHNEEQLPVVLYAHGGGCVLHRAEESDPYCYYMARRYRCVVINVDYRLAPEHPAPAGQLDYCAAWKWLLSEGAQSLNADPSHSVFLGPSGGGNIVLGAALRLLDEGAPLPTLLAPLYPMLDDRNCTPSSIEFTDPCLWGRPQSLAAWNFYINGLTSSGKEPDCYTAPARREDFSGLPPVFTFVGELELIRDETIDLVAKLSRSGVSVEFALYPGCFHAFDGFAPDAAVSKRAQRRLNERMIEALHP